MEFFCCYQCTIVWSIVCFKFFSNSFTSISYKHPTNLEKCQLSLLSTPFISYLQYCSKSFVNNAYISLLHFKKMDARHARKFRSSSNLHADVLKPCSCFFESTKKAPNKNNPTMVDSIYNDLHLKLIVNIYLFIILLNLSNSSRTTFCLKKLKNSN